MPTHSKIDTVINAFEKANKQDIVKAINSLNEREVHQLAKIAPHLRSAVASPEVTTVETTQIPKVLIRGTKRYIGASVRKGTLNRETVKISNESDKISKEEHEEINEKYADRVGTPKDQYIRFEGEEHFWDLIMKDKEENGWKFKDEK